MQEFFSDDIVTVVEELDRFYPAEAYHQNYYRNNPTQGYCMAVVAPKINKVRHHFPDKTDEDF
jgi:peptide-methionine (S)-S-oxide reductase